MELIILFCLFFLFCLGVYIYQKNSDIFNPIFLFSFPIFISFIVFLFFYNDSTIKNETLLIYLAGILSFSSGFIYHRNINPYKLSYKQNIFENPLKVNKTMVVVLNVISIIGVIATIIYVIQAAFAGPFGDNVIRNLRYMGNYEKTRSAISIYGIAITKVLFMVALYEIFILKKKFNKKWLSFLTIGLIFGFLATIARTELIEIIVSTYYISTLKNRISVSKKNIVKTIKEKTKTFFLLVSVIFIFILIAIQTNKVGSLNLFDEEFFFYRYAGLELKNFNSYILGNDFTTLGYFSLGILGRLLSWLKLGPNNDLYILIQELYHGPVCSFVSAPYTDFGLLGVIVVMFVQGFFHSYIYMKTLNFGGFWLIFYTTCIYSDLMAFYAFQYMMSSQIYVFLTLMLLQMKFRSNKTKNIRNDV